MTFPCEPTQGRGVFEGALLNLWIGHLQSTGKSSLHKTDIPLHIGGWAGSGRSLGSAPSNLQPEQLSQNGGGCHLYQVKEVYFSSDVSGQSGTALHLS